MPDKKIARTKNKYKNKKIKTGHDLLNSELNAKTIKNMFKKKTINTIAEKANFSQRKRKLDVYKFFYH